MRSVLFFLLIHIFCYQIRASNDSLISVEANAYLLKGSQFLGETFNLDSAAYFAEKAIELFASINDTASIATAYNNLGLVSYYKGDYPLTLDLWKKSLALQLAVDNKREISRMYTNIGAVYFNISDDVEALKNYLNAQKYAEEIQDSLRLMTVYANIAAIYGQKSNTFDKALEFHFKALAVGEHLKDNNTLGTVSGNIADILLAQDKDSLALIYYEKCLVAHKGTREESYALQQISRVYSKKKDYEKAREFLQASYEVANEFGLVMDKAFALHDLGIISIQIGKVDQAIELLEESFSLGKSIQSVRIIHKTSGALKKQYANKGMYQKAYEYSLIHEQYQDSIYNAELDNKISELITDYKLEKKEDEITMLNQEKKLQELQYKDEVRRKKTSRNIAIGIGFIILIISGGLWSRLRYVRRSSTILQQEKDRSERLLLNILPVEVAEELKEKGKADARDFENVSILFTDFVSFTETAEKLSATELVQEINACFEGFDHILEKYQIEKIKTIGDAYMAAGGLPVPTEDSVRNTILAALDMQAFIWERRKYKDQRGEATFKMRVGIHTGPVVAGIVGVKKFQYDIWGDTVNTASRMESASEAGKVNISNDTYKIAKDDPQFIFESRGKIAVKGKGEIEMLFVSLKNKENDG